MGEEQGAYRLGDIIRWRGSTASPDYDYGMVIGEPQLVTQGIYTFREDLADICEPAAGRFAMDNPLYSITVFSFGEQRVVILYKNPEDVPLFIEKVTFSKKSS
tara:strand:+ start:44 stop:352 length:309 start_codon:yes stop_codon:yes gene_type:complete